MLRDWIAVLREGILVKNYPHLISYVMPAQMGTIRRLENTGRTTRPTPDGDSAERDEKQKSTGLPVYDATLHEE